MGGWQGRKAETLPDCWLEVKNFHGELIKKIKYSLEFMLLG